MNDATQDKELEAGAQPKGLDGSAKPVTPAIPKTILLVEDEGYIRELVAAILTIEGYNVLDAGSPAEALELCQDHQGVVDLIITEALMPLVTGMELVNRIRESRPSMKAIFISGYPNAFNERLGIDSADWLAKPCTPKMLVSKIETVLRTEKPVRAPSQMRAGVES